MDQSQSKDGRIIELVKRGANLVDPRLGQPLGKRSSVEIQARETGRNFFGHVHDGGYVHACVKTAISVNTMNLTGVALEKALGQRLRDLLASVAWLKNWEVARGPAAPEQGCDFKATLPLSNGRTAELRIVCKANARPYQFPNILARGQLAPQDKRVSRVWVLAAPYLSPRMAQLCQENGWSWFDLAGNCYLSVPDAFQLERTGQSPMHKLPKAGANLSTPQAARILRALLATDNAGRRWTQRDLQFHVQPSVSIGLINKVIRHLQDEAFLERNSDGGFKLRAPLELLTAWRDAHRFDRHQRRSYSPIQREDRHFA